eukprot:CAMPEP_0204341948 /NCGR_PEP_ID=MMETSP0469-20131031/23752_1 /ASSEMBLY_ACC=CAM_ASM_000384 /TAXON_ID=2969 /ORGANISM="Oxyrrhis marina" /LENGTH=63 /DNA_ID=CAMNT_0051326765 /DNA_START=165 /DNA_END=353 /DNA_ORIENTATION=+
MTFVVDGKGMQASLPRAPPLGGSVGGAAKAAYGSPAGGPAPGGPSLWGPPQETDPREPAAERP